MAPLALRGAHKRFADIAALQAVDLEVNKGEFCALPGPSGCGRSTRLRLIAGLEDVSEGSIESKSAM